MFPRLGWDCKQGNTAKETELCKEEKAWYWRNCFTVKQLNT